MGSKVVSVNNINEANAQKAAKLAGGAKIYQEPYELRQKMLMLLLSHLRAIT